MESRGGGRGIMALPDIMNSPRKTAGGKGRATFLSDIILARPNLLLGKTESSTNEGNVYKSPYMKMELFTFLLSPLSCLPVPF